MLAISVLALSLALHLRISSGFSFTINNTPQQCSGLNISVIGSGQPPYTAVIVPYGPPTLAHEVREVLVVPFSGISQSTSFKLTYPVNSQFVVVVSNPSGSAMETASADKLSQVSDSTGFGAGGASVVLQVQTGSSDSSCYGNSESIPPFTFSTTPDNQLTQCTPTRVFWGSGKTQG